MTITGDDRSPQSRTTAGRVLIPVLVGLVLGLVVLLIMQGGQGGRDSADGGAAVVESVVDAARFPVALPEGMDPSQVEVMLLPPPEAAEPHVGGTASHLPWGLYQIYWSRDYGERLAASLEPLAERPDYVMFYRDLGRDFPQHGIDTIHGLGAVPIISLELGSWHRPDEEFLPRIVAGELDEFFMRWAAEAVADGRRVLLRFGFEANGDWFSWGGQPEAYVSAWQRVHALFEEAGAHNVEWVWSPNVVSIPRDPGNSLHHYYPGDEVVDWLGLDGYNFGDAYDEWHAWESFEQVFGEVVADLAQRHPGKPIMIAETGCAPGEPGQKAQWIREAYASVRAMPAVEALIWFNLDKRREGELDWRIGSSDESLAAFNETFAAPRESGDPDR